MSLRFALLALLSAEPMTGYDIRRYFDDSVVVWNAPHTQVYPELRRLEGEGLLESETLRRGARGTKRAYRLTPAGTQELAREASRTWPYPERERDPYRLKATYFEWSNPEDVRRQLQAHIEHFERWRDIWEAHVPRLNAEDLLKVRLSGMPDDEHTATIAFKQYAYEGLLARARMEIEWARRGLILVDELEAGGWDGRRPQAGEPDVPRRAVARGRPPGT